MFMNMYMYVKDVAFNIHIRLITVWVKPRRLYRNHLLCIAFISLKGNLNVQIEGTVTYTVTNLLCRKINEHHTECEFEQELQKIFVAVSGADGAFLPRDAQMALLLELCVLCVECNLTSLALGSLQATNATDLTHNPELLLIRESLIYQLNARHLGDGGGTIGVEGRLKAISKITNLLRRTKRRMKYDSLVEYICVVLWNLSIPLLCQEFRELLINPLKDIANALKDINRYNVCKIL